MVVELAKNQIKDVISKRFNIGQIGGIFSFLKQHNVINLFFCGTIARPDWRNITPIDFTGIKILLQILKLSAKGDDALLNIIYQECQSAGFNIVSCEQLKLFDYDLCNTNSIIKPSKQDLIDISLGSRILFTLSKLDIGQAAVVYNSYVLGIEAAEGTDKLIERCSLLRKASKGGVLIKMMKDGQNPFLDPPVIGCDTIYNLVKYGYNGIALSNVIILNQKRVIELCDESGVFIYYL